MNVKVYSAQLAKLANGALPLQDFLNSAVEIHPEIEQALQGIYCGREGRITEPCFDGKHTLVMGWYTASDTPRVEFSYIG